MTDTRKDKRAPLSLKVRFKSATLDEFVEQYSQDISRGGIFIKSKKPMKIGTLLKFEFQLKDESSLIHGVGRVVWVRAPEDATDASPAGMGIKFIKMDADSRALVQDIVDRRGGGTGAFEAGENEGGGDEGSFFPDSGPAVLPPPEDRTSVRHASEFLAEALMGAGVSAADEAKESAEEARRRSEEIQKERERAAQARAAAEAEAAKRAAEVPKGSAAAPAVDEDEKPRRPASPATTTDEIPTLIASRVELDAARAEADAAESATTLADETVDPAAKTVAAAKSAAKPEPAKAPAKTESKRAEPDAKAEAPQAAAAPSSKPKVPRLEDTPVTSAAPERPPAPKEPSSMPILLIVVLLLAIGGGVWFFFLRGEPEAVATPEPTPTVEPTPEPGPEPLPEPEPEPEVVTTQVRVTSTPEAEIFVDGESVGTTSAEGLEIALPVGVASSVEARAAGFAAVTQEITPEEGAELAPLAFTLEALPYVIEVVTEPEGARVSVGRRTLQSPGEVTLERWTTDVSVFANKPGFLQGSQVIRQTDFSERDGAMRATARITLAPRAAPTETTMTATTAMTATMAAAMTETTTETTEAPAMVEEAPAMVEEAPAMVETPPPSMTETPPAMVEAPPPAMTEEPVPDNPF